MMTFANAVAKVRKLRAHAADTSVPASERATAFLLMKRMQAEHRITERDIRGHQQREEVIASWAAFVGPSIAE